MVKKNTHTVNRRPAKIPILRVCGMKTGKKKAGKIKETEAKKY
jgi:hypothetical protein